LLLSDERIKVSGEGFAAQLGIQVFSLGLQDHPIQLVNREGRYCTHSIAQSLNTFIYLLIIKSINCLQCKKDSDVVPDKI